MLRTIFWSVIFFLGAAMVAIQPACHDFESKDLHEPLVSLVKK